MKNHNQWQLIKRILVEDKGSISIISGSGSHSGKQEEEIKRSVKISDAAT